MLWKNIMEDKKLNLNQPFLSVRNKTGNSFPIIPQLPPFKSELKSGPVRNPGSVPFLWENAPGQPKEETKLQPNKLPISPKIPLGLYTKAINDDESANKFEELETSVSGNSDEAYVDALDTLSRTESVFLNCSMSGLSNDLEKKPFGNLDPQTRKFMMDRFLPAAKEVVQEQKQVKKMVNRDKPFLRYGPSFAKRYSNYQANEEEEESDDEYDEHGTFPAVCGLLPRFCLNPVLSMSVRTRVPMSPAGSYSKTENESKSDISEVQSVDKNRKAEQEEIKISSRNTALLEEKVFLGNSEETKHDRNKGIKTFQEFLADKGSSDEFDSGGLVFDRTVYNDTVRKVESPKSSFCSPKQDTKGDHDITIKRMEVIESSLEDLKKFDTVIGETKFGGLNIVSSMDKSNKKRGLEIRNAYKQNQEFDLVSTKAESHKKFSEFPVPPPLPKSPSDSWLCRTLPSISTKNLPRHSFQGASTNPHDQVTKDFKWEAIVKSTNVKRYSEEMLTTIPEA
ncbi:hypothetical protein ACJIZ3_007316 [Penstemon smallii]|uniref:Uncharacterized protein n=1 Tax=Penstemon smallii TaxID=265156 RepID=A0ABD3SAG5_9LAMI